MPAPNEPLRAPYPNLVVPGWPRVAVHVFCIDVAGGVPTLNASRSSQGLSVADGGAGVYTLAFPPGGTGATGIVILGAQEIAAAGASAASEQSVNATTLNFATGVCSINTFDADTPAATDVVGAVTGMILVLLGPGGAI